MNCSRSTFWKSRFVGRVERWEFDCFSTHGVKHADFFDVRTIVALMSQCVPTAHRLRQSRCVICEDVHSFTDWMSVWYFRLQIKLYVFVLFCLQVCKMIVLSVFNFCWILEAFAKLRKAAVGIHVCLSVCPSARNSSAPTGGVFLKFEI
jgi:hypothetical protein